MENQLINIPEELADNEAVKYVIDELDRSDIEDTHKYVMKELITSKKDDIRFKTELTVEQLRSITQLLTADKIMKAQSLSIKKDGMIKATKEIESVPQYMTKLLMELMVSYARKGRAEFVDAWKGGEKQANFNLLDGWGMRQK